MATLETLEEILLRLENKVDEISSIVADHTRWIYMGKGGLALLAIITTILIGVRIW